MGLFSSPSSYLGVDIGSSSIKVAELRNEKGRPRLVTYAFSEQNLDISKSDLVEIQVKTAKIMQRICQQAKTASNRAVASLPSYAVFSSVINLPKMSKKDLASAIRWEAKKVIPLPLEEMILDWRILEDEEIVKRPGKTSSSLISKSSSGKNIKLLLTGAGKNLVSSYMKIFKMAGLTLLSLEPESFALIRSLVGHDKATIMIINLGALISNISIIEEGIPFLNRSIDVGGQAITNSISKSFQISLERAEQFKKDVGMGKFAAANEIPKTIEEVVATIVNEIKYTIGLYENQGQKSIEKIILTGGAAILNGLSLYLSNILNIKTFIGDPWARIIYPIELKPILQEIGSRMAIAVGLAMREIT